MNWHCDHTGKTSMMRIGMMSCTVIGAILCLSGVYAVANSLPDAAALVTAGAGLMGSSGWAKAVQSKYEKGGKQ